jgi:small-conductance mechanosensitive channel
MYSDKLAAEADWKDGIHAFRAKTLERIQHLEAQLEMLMIRIKDLEEPPKAPHPPKKEEEMKL